MRGFGNNAGVIAAIAAAMSMGPMSTGREYMGTPVAFGNQRRKRKPGTKRLKPAHGPCSINAESDMQRLVRAGKVDEAIAFWEAHHSRRGVSRMRWGSEWYTLAKRDFAHSQGAQQE